MCYKAVQLGLKGPLEGQSLLARTNKVPYTVVFGNQEPQNMVSRRCHGPSVIFYFTAEISCSDGWDIPLIDYRNGLKFCLQRPTKREYKNK